VPLQKTRAGEFRDCAALSNLPPIKTEDIRLLAPDDEALVLFAVADKAKRYHRADARAGRLEAASVRSPRRRAFTHSSLASGAMAKRTRLGDVGIVSFATHGLAADDGKLVDELPQVLAEPRCCGTRCSAIATMAPRRDRPVHLVGVNDGDADVGFCIAAWLLSFPVPDSVTSSH